MTEFAALANLYQSVVIAEAGLGGEYADPTGRCGKDADAGFRQALEDLEAGSASDRLRAHQDYANFLLRQAQDRLHNHAFQMAAGVEHPLFTAMTAWSESRRQYEAARDLAAAVEDRAAINVSLARLCAVWPRSSPRSIPTATPQRRRFAAPRCGKDSSMRRGRRPRKRRPRPARQPAGLSSSPLRRK